MIPIKDRYKKFLFDRHFSLRNENKQTLALFTSIISNYATVLEVNNIILAFPIDTKKCSEILSNIDFSANFVEFEGIKFPVPKLSTNIGTNLYSASHNIYFIMLDKLYLPKAMLANRLLDKLNLHIDEDTTLKMLELLFAEQEIKITG